MISKDDWHLCEGFLNVFIKQETLRQTIVYQKAKKENAGSCSASFQSIRDKVILDLGSEKETISVE